MKKTISYILCAVLIFSMFSIGMTAYAEDASNLRFAVASDLHYCKASAELEKLQDDDIYFYADRRAAMENESGLIIDSFLAQCASDDSIDYVLISGDLCDNGREYPEDHRAVAQKLKDFEDSTGKSVFVIDGNHDLGTDRNTDIDTFKEIYADFGYDKALEKRDEDCSYTADLGEKYRLIALDSCDPTVSTADGMSAEKISWVHEQCKKAEADGRYPILMMHHNLLDHLPMQRIISRNFIVRFHYTTAELFADWGIKVVLTGHEHCSDATSFTSLLGNTITDFATTSLTMYPLEYRIFEFDDDEIRYQSKAVEGIDTDALTQNVSGYTPEMIALMNDDLDAYSKGFLKKGVEYRLELSLSMEKIGISEGEAFYKTVNTAVSGLLDLLERPLYGDDSVSTIAAEYGIEIPESNYYNGWDLATDLVAAHYAGGETADINSTEVTVLLKLANLILKDVPANVSDEVLFSAVNELLGGEMTADFVKLGTKLFGSVSAGEYLILAIASPIIDEFGFDSDGVDDNNGTLNGYGTVNIKTNINAIGNNLENIINAILKYVSYAMKYILQIVK